MSAAMNGAEGRAGSGAVAWEIDMSAPSPPPRTHASDAGTSGAPSPSLRGARTRSTLDTKPGTTPTTLPRLGGSDARKGNDHEPMVTSPSSRGVYPSKNARPVPKRCDPPSSNHSQKIPSRTRLSPMPASSTRGVASSREMRQPSSLTRGQPRPHAVVASLHAQQVGPQVTAKGRAIQQDLDHLADDYFGNVSSRAPRDGGETGEAVHLLPGVSPSNYASTLAKVRGVYTAEAVSDAWRQGPANTEGRIFDASDSNLLCMDVLTPSDTAPRGRRATGSSSASAPGLCVVGSADHGLKVFDLATLREKKNLYNKANGHTDWVTCCRLLPDCRVISGGMDSKLCLWDPVTSGGVTGARCHDLLGHTASISQVEIGSTEGLSTRAVSASYDRTLRIWDCASFGREVGVLAGHKAPVMQFDWCGIHVLSGDRQGQAKVWDLERATCLCTMATKRGQMGSVRQFYHDAVGELTMFGDQGGVLTVLDLRQGKRPVAQREAHPGGVLSAIRGVCDSSGAPFVVTAGADKRICALEPRMGFAPLHVWSDHTDFIYSLETFGDLVVSGAGNGWVLVHDVTTGGCCYGLGAGKNAIREIFVAPQCLVAAGDDGDAVVYDF